jgi:DNA-binding response OmpR family regulator
MQQPARILVIEDDDSIRDFIEMSLGDEGYSTAAAPNGAVALSMIPEYQPTIILLDLYMPHMDGSAFVHAYRQLPTPHAKIIMLTAARDTQTAVLNTAVDGVLAKPFNLDELYATIQAFL